MGYCTNCGTETSNPKFCSKSCSATYTNKAQKKRKPTGSCKSCGAPIKISRKMCAICRASADKKNLTIGELRFEEKSKGRHPSWLHHHVRVLNRQWNKRLSKMPCRKCGYSLHVELAHIKPLTEFPDETPLGEVNSPLNLVTLCPNCHWELDSDLFSIEDLLKA